MSDLMEQSYKKGYEVAMKQAQRTLAAQLADQKQRLLDLLGEDEPPRLPQTEEDIAWNRINSGKIQLRHEILAQLEKEGSDGL